MDKLEYRTKTEQMLLYMKKKSYEKAMDIADSIKWNKVKNVPMICSASEVYEYNKEYQKSRDILFLAYDREPDNKKVIFRLATLALKMNDVEEALDCYKEFISIAPDDPNQYVLKYLIMKSKGAQVKELIAVLKKLKEAEYIEKWAFQLAMLYREAGMISECIEECDDLIAWFSEGKYIYKAMELKKRYKPLTPLQQEKYNARFATSAKKVKEADRVPEESKVQVEESKEADVKELKVESEIVEETMEEKKETTTLSIEEMLQEWEEKQKENAQMIREEIQKVEEEKEKEEVPTEQSPSEDILSKDVRKLMEELETESADIEAQKIKSEDEVEKVEEDKTLVQKVAEQLASLDIKEALTPQALTPQAPVKEAETVAAFSEAARVIEEIETHDEEGEIKLGDTQSMAAVAKALKETAEETFPEEDEEDQEDEKSPFDTGFIVKGRYDLEAQSEIGLKAGLTEEQKKLFSYFVPVHGMSEQLVTVLENDKKCKSRYGTSRTGNLLIIGRKGSGKTVLAVDVVKAIQKGRKTKPGKVGIMTADALNKKNAEEITRQLVGGAIIIEKASRLSRQSIATLCEVMEGQTGEMLVVLEDQRRPLEKMLSAYPQFAKKFTSRLELPVFINDELVTFGQTYAKENGYKIDEMGILALYSQIDMLQRDERVVTVADVKEILDDAIENSQKSSFKKFLKSLVGKTTDDSDRIILREEDFK